MAAEFNGDKNPFLDEELEFTGYGRCLNCEGAEPQEVLDAFEGFCSSECAREYRDNAIDESDGMEDDR